MYDVIIIGRGPAGISASLYTSRANLKTLVIGKTNSAIAKAEKVENYYGFSEPFSGKQLLEDGEKQAKRLGVEIIDAEVVSVEQGEYFEIYTSNQSFSAKSLLLATGQHQKKIKIEGLDDFEGRGVSYCTTCDGFFYKNLKVGILGYKDYSIHEAREMETFTDKIKIFTNGNELELTEDFLADVENYEICKTKIKAVVGNDFVEKLIFEDGVEEELDGLFVAYDSASSTDFARKLGIVTENNAIIVDGQQLTNVDGVFAAGDCTGGFKQIATAVGQGAMAGRKIIEYIRSKKI